MAKDKMAKDSQANGFDWEQVVGYIARGRYDVEVGEEVVPEKGGIKKNVMTGAELSGRLFDVEDKLSKTNALLADALSKYFIEAQYDTHNSNEAKQFLTRYPRMKLLIELAFDTTLEAERMLKEISEED